MTRVQLRQLRPQGSRVEPQMKLRLLLYAKLLPQRRRGAAALAKRLRLREPTAQRLHQPLGQPSLITQ